MKRQQKENKSASLLVLLLLLGAGFCAYLALLPEKNSPKSRGVAGNAHTAKVEGRVNQHLFMTSKKMELDEQKAALSNSFYAPTVGDSIWPKAEHNPKNYGVDHSPDANENNAYRDLNRYHEELNYESPNAVIQGELYDSDKKYQYEEAYKKEYVRQFVENARRNGYDIKVDDNMRVISVKPLRRPTQEQQIFDSSGTGAR